MEKYLEKGITLIMEYGPKILLAIVILIVGLIVIKQIIKTMNKIMLKRKLDASLHSFIKSLVGIVLKLLLAISVLTMIGVEMTSFIAILGAAGLAIGLALSGTLQNFAGGVMILIFKPFKVDDYIAAQGHEGFVKEIQIFNTILLTMDNKKIIIPNSPLSSNSMINYTAEKVRRVDFTFGIGYGDNIDKAREEILKVIKANEKILNEPEEPMIKVKELADSSVNFEVRVWTKTEDYWDIYFYMYEPVKKAFDKAGVSIPFPQQDVHVHTVK